MANKYLDYSGLQELVNKMKALVKVTGVKGNAESSYRTGNVNLTPANIGAVAKSGNETVAGNKTFSGTTTVTATSKFTGTMGDVLKPDAFGIIQSPIPKYLWHDLWAFCRATTPKYYTTTDGTTWTEGTLNKNLFVHKEAISKVNIIDSTISGSRWVWTGGGFAYCSGSWLVIGVAYSATIAKFDVLLEEYSDSETWTTLLSVNGVSANPHPIWIKTNAPSNNNIRLTITRNSESANTTNLPIVSLRWLTTRWGDQGKGSEFEYPYQWNDENSIYPIKNNESSLGLSSYKWANVYATKFIGALQGNADSSTSVVSQGSAGSDTTSRHLWFSTRSQETQRAHSDNLKYTPSTNTISANISGEASTVNGHTVNADVPSDAVFTDTTYEPATASADGLMSAEDKANLDALQPVGAIPSCDLDTLTETMVGQLITANTYTNAPTTAGTLEVVASGTETGQCAQRLYNGSSMYYRYRSGSGFGHWYKVTATQV